MIGRSRRTGPGAAALALLALAGCSAAPELRTASHGTRRISVDDAAASAWVSRYREQHGLSGVSRDPALDAIAQAQADAMAAVGEISHTVAGPLPARLARIDRGKGAAAENVSAGYRDLQAALAGWQRSPEHDKNLLFAPLRRIGIAGASAPDTRLKTYWALVMTD